METRDEAILWLQEQGLFARTRDWAMGASVLTWRSQEVDSDSGITVLHQVVCLYPVSGVWFVCDLQNPRGSAKPCGSLTIAVQEAVQLLGGAANGKRPEPK